MEKLFFFLVPVMWNVDVIAGILSTTLVHTVDGRDNVTLCHVINKCEYCFYTDGSEMSWDDAREFCERKNSTLPVVKNEDVDDVFQLFLANASYSVDVRIINTLRSSYTQYNVIAKLAGTSWVQALLLFSLLPLGEIKMYNRMAWWRSGWRVGLVIERSRVNKGSIVVAVLQLLQRS